MKVREVIEKLSMLPAEGEVLTMSEAYYDIAVLGPVGYVGMLPDGKAVAIVQSPLDVGLDG